MSEKIVNNVQFMLKYQYYQDTSKFTQSPMKSLEVIVQEDIVFTYPDILFWFSNKDCCENMDQIKRIWDKTPQQTINRSTLSLFLRRYAEEVVDKHNKYQELLERLKQIQLVEMRTLDFLNEKNGITMEIMEELEKEDEIKQQDYKTITFSIEYIEDFNVIDFQKDSKPYNYYLEISYQTQSKRVKGVLETFAMRLTFKAEFSLDFQFDIGTLQMNLVREWGQEQLVVAYRNLDPFTSLNEESSLFPMKIVNGELHNDGQIQLINGKTMISNKNQYVNVMMKVSNCENITNFLEQRLHFLKLKYQQTMKQQFQIIYNNRKCHLYKTKLRILLKPFDTIKFDDNGLQLMKLAEKKQSTGCTNCTIQ